MVDKVIDFKITNDGKINALRLTSNSILSDHYDSGWTQCMNSPAIVPIEPLDVKAGETVSMQISYEMGGEMSSLQIKRV
jgi:predicted RNA methylase